jgi:DNA-directed RNA polymerase specialized sigma subunit
VTRCYSNFQIPTLESLTGEAVDPPTLADQAKGQSTLLPAEAPHRANRTSTLGKPARQAVVDRFRSERSLYSIARELGISWDSVARILEQAGLRARR